MASGEINSNTYVTFEVTMLRDAVDQTTALQGLRRAFDWNLRERATLVGDLDRTDTTRPWVIEEGVFTQLSRDVWGVETYGENAADQLKYEARMTRVLVFQNGYSHEDRDNPKYPVEGAHVKLSTAQMRLRTQEVWDKIRSPFEPEYDNEIGDHAVWMGGGSVTRDRLADYVRARGYDGHNLHGALGKTLDLFGVASGVLSPDNMRSAGVFDFIEASELRSIMDERISGSTRWRISERIDRQLRDQLQTGQPVKGIEVVVDGSVTREKSHPQVKLMYQRIATSSLHALATSYSRDCQARRFLEQF